jgi:hypothetical protein
LLISSMVRHHFFRGGHPNRSMTSLYLAPVHSGPNSFVAEIKYPGQI